MRGKAPGPAEIPVMPEAGINFKRGVELLWRKRFYADLSFILVERPDTKPGAA